MFETAKNLFIVTIDYLGYGALFLENKYCCAGKFGSNPSRSFGFLQQADKRTNFLFYKYIENRYAILPCVTKMFHLHLYSSESGLDQDDLLSLGGDNNSKNIQHLHTKFFKVYEQVNC